MFRVLLTPCFPDSQDIQSSRPCFLGTFNIWSCCASQADFHFHTLVFWVVLLQMLDQPVQVRVHQFHSFIFSAQVFYRGLHRVGSRAYPGRDWEWGENKPWLEHQSISGSTIFFFYSEYTRFGFSSHLAPSVNVYPWSFGLDWHPIQDVFLSSF